MLGRIIVGGIMMGLVEFDDPQRVVHAAQKIGDTYPDEPTVLKMDGKNIKITPRPGTVKQVFAPDIKRQPRGEAPTPTRRPR